MRRVDSAWTGRRAGSIAVSVIAIGTWGAGCADDETESVRVFAAASLADAFDELAEAYTARTGTPVELNVAGSAALRLQLDEGASADVFAPADPVQLDRLEVEPADEATVFATNELVVAHPIDGDPVGLADFDRDELLLGACAPEVPCGAYARAVFAAAGIRPALDTEESDVRALAAKVAEGELDAGIVYATDVLGDPRLDSVAIPPDMAAAVAITYPVVPMSDRPEAATFIDFLLAADGQAILARNGFGAP
ncbi:MAG: molybdate ABC transporter substrate-binding protein [Actinomycetota bacterium]